jgi:hypothetical protein
VLELNRQVRDLYRAYEKKHLKPEIALELASEFVLDLINGMGDQLSDTTPLMENWQPFAPFEFLLSLNETLKKYKDEGEQNLTASERAILTNSKAMLGALVRAALASHPDSYPGEEHFQIPHAVARELLLWTEK